MRKKLLIIAAVVGAVLLAAVFLLVRAASKRPPTPPSGPTDAVLPSRPASPTAAASQTLIVSGIAMDNFMLHPVEVKANGHMLIEETVSYSYVYYPESQSFLISILSSPFALTRQKAEQALLKKLNVSQGEACRLKVSITTPAFVNPQEAGKIYGLSFCR